MDNSSFEQYKKMKKEYFDFVKKNGESLVKFKMEQLKEIFKGYDLEEIKWDQFTPYFNDGDACEFTVYDFLVKFKGEDEGGDYDDGHYYVWDVKRLPKFENNKTLLDKLDKFKFNDNEDDLFLQAFGDHVTVTYDVDKNVFKVEETEHD